MEIEQSSVIFVTDIYDSAKKLPMTSRATVSRILYLQLPGSKHFICIQFFILPASQKATAFPFRRTVSMFKKHIELGPKN